MSKKMGKAQSERIHFKRRLRERYGLRINRFDYRNMVDLVRSNDSYCLLKQSNTRSIHRILYGERAILVVYDRKRRELVTALPPHLTIQEIETYTGT